jgi:hypothetical protein
MELATNFIEDGLAFLKSKGSFELKNISLLSLINTKFSGKTNGIKKKLEAAKEKAMEEHSEEVDKIAAVERKMRCA